VLQEAEAAVERAASQIRRRLDTTGIRDSLYANFDHPRWDNVARRVGLNSSPTLRTGGAKSRIWRSFPATAPTEVTPITAHWHNPFHVVSRVRLP